MNRIITLILFLCASLVVNAQEKINEINIGGQKISAISFSNDGTMVAVAANCMDIKIYNPSNGELISTLKGHQNIVNSVEFSKHGHYLVSGAWDKTVKIWDIKTSTVVNEFVDAEDFINNVCFSPDDSLVAAGDDAGKVYMWSIKDNKLLNTFTNATDAISSLSFNIDGRYLAAGAWDNNLYVWSTIPYENEYKLKYTINHKAAIYDIAFSHNNMLMATASEDRTIKITKVSTGENISDIHQSSNGPMTGVSWMPNDKFLFASSSNGNINVYNTSSYWLQLSLKDHTAGVNTIKICNDGKFAISGGDDSKLLVWDITDLLYSDCIKEKMKANKYLTNPKGEFETTAEYNKRLEKYKEVKKNFRDECEAAQKIQTERIEYQTYEKVSYYPERISTYNADKEEYVIYFGIHEFTVKMPMEDAKTFKTSYKNTIIYAVQQTDPVSDIFFEFNYQFTHPISKKTYKIGPQINTENNNALNKFINDNYLE